MSLLSTRVWACLLRNTHVLQDGISRRKCDTRHNIGGVGADNITLSYPVTPGFGDLSMGDQSSVCFPPHVYYPQIPRWIHIAWGAPAPLFKIALPSPGMMARRCPGDLNGIEEVDQAYCGSLLGSRDR